MDSTALRRAASAALALNGLIHLALSPQQLEEKAYVGVLFVLGGVACLLLAAAILRTDDPRAWMVGALLAAAMGVAFILSRTTGLPGFNEPEWEPLGILTLVLEAVVVALAAVRGRARASAPGGPATAA